MRWVECGASAALLLAGFAYADAPTYGKVETFQPGKKYNCVPTADHKGWDCNESGKAEARQPDATSAEQPPAAPPTSAEPVQKSSALPAYLTNAAATGQPVSRPQRQAAPSPAPAAAVTPAPPREQVSAPAEQPVTRAPAEKAAPAQASAPSKTEPPPAATAQSATPATKSESAAAQPAPAPAVVRSAPPVPARPASASEDFLALPGDGYVIELKADEAHVPALPRGKVYKVDLHQRPLLLWGPFDSVDAARAARDDIAAQGLAPGWPRRIGPLQSEVRRSSE